MTSPRNKDPWPIRVWQWNCRGYRQKRQALQLLIQATETPPVVIALQEVGSLIKLPGYKQFQCSGNLTTAVLVHRNIPAEHTQFDSIPFPHDLVSLLPTKRDAERLYILNLYSSPKATGHTFNLLFSLVKQTIGPHALIIVGDFNAPHTAWGYPHCTRKGRLLWDHIQAHRLTVQSDPSIPTRVGNSVQRDSSPDLTLTYHVKHACWSATPDTLGSDHFILQTDVTVGSFLRRSPRQTFLPNWDSFRQVRQTLSPPELSISGLENWVQQILTDARQTRSALDPEIPSDVVDSHLQHLWAAYRSVQRRWRKQKYNRKLRSKLSGLTAEIERYSTQLAQDQWHQICNQMKGNLGMKRTWSLLRHLLDPTRTKTEQTHRLTKVTQNFPGTNEQLIDKVCSLYIPTGETQQLPLYQGPPNTDLDADITEAEVRSAILALRPGSAPGPDGITNKMLRNLDDLSVSALTDYFNYFWKLGSLPQAWRHAQITLIPKPGKPLTIEHLRPISLTSCIGKVMEHIILSRLTLHLTSTDALPHSMIGFRPGLSTQDVLLQLSRDIIIPTAKRDTAAILALDLTKAFDRVSHAAIMRGLGSTAPGERTYNYVRAFLTARTAFLQIGDLKSKIITLPSIGTPQGAVLSPLLFNLAILNIPKRLETIPHLHYSLYADDITLWVTGGSDAHIEDTLQQGAQAVSEEALLAGLACSPAKSELLLLPSKFGSRSPPNISVSIDGHLIPEVPILKVLGLVIQRNRGNTQYLSKLSSHVNQTIGLLKRISGRNHGLREEERLRLVQTFVISRITYSLPYLQTTDSDLAKVNNLIRKAYRAALQIPHNAPTARLDRLGIHNTAQELIEAHHINQLRRLSTTSAGEHILSRLGLRAPDISDPKVPIPRATHACLRVRPLPRNMHPEHHRARREERARALAKKLPIRPDIMYVDAAEYRHHDGYAVAAINSPDSPPVTCLTVRTTSPAAAEEAAIALALTTRPTPTIIITDSKTAIQNFARGSISLVASKILSKNPPTTSVEIIWTPAHTGLGGNEAAHDVARGLTIRAGASLVPYHGARSARDRLITYHDVVMHYRLSRRHYPPAHPGLTNYQERLWRLLQTNTLICRAVLHRIYPSQYPSPNCLLCGDPATLVHSMWACPQDPFPYVNSDEQWEGALGSSDLEVQTLLVTRAAIVAAKLKPAATTNH